jgi:heterodisulfide reductase subunit A
MTLAKVEGVTGRQGDFHVTIRRYPRYIDEERCVGCGLCAAKCPAKAPHEFNLGMDKRKAVFVPFAQTVPLKYTIDRNACLYFKAADSGKKGKCKACLKFCKKDAIGFDQKETVTHLNVGAIILTPGFQPFDPVGMPAYQYSEFENVVTSIDFERILAATGPTEGRLCRPSDDAMPEKIAWLQCVGSRDVNRCDHAYCSSVCCMYAIKQATVAAEHSTVALDTAIFFMDMRTYGKDFEKYYNRAKAEIGTRFIRCRIHSLQELEDKRIALRYVGEDGAITNEDFDMIVLSVGLETSRSGLDLADTMGIDIDDDHFAKTSSLQPVATSRPGI